MVKKTEKAAAAPPQKDKEGRVWIWTQSMTDKDKWSIGHIPKDEHHTPYIKRSSKNSDGSHTYFIYRDLKYIDCTNDLEEAKKVAFSGKMRAERVAANQKIRDYVNKTPRDAPEYAKLNKEQQQTIADVFPWAVPRKSDLEGRGVKVTTRRSDLLSKNEKKAEGLPMEAVIKRAKDGNPKKEGSDAWSRWELLFQHAGKTVGDFVRAHGNPTTLKNAVKTGYIKVDGLS